MHVYRCVQEGRGSSYRQVLQGLSLTLLDVEHLAKALCASNDWSAALDRYAEEHDEYYSALRRILGWMTELTWTPGSEADERRGRVFRRMLSDREGSPTRSDSDRLVRTTIKQGGSYWASTKTPDQASNFSVSCEPSRPTPFSCNFPGSGMIGVSGSGHASPAGVPRSRRQSSNA
jgi:hypothetical protein